MLRAMRKFTFRIFQMCFAALHHARLKDVSTRPPEIVASPQQASVIISQLQAEIKRRKGQVSPGGL